MKKLFGLFILVLPLLLGMISCKDDDKDDSETVTPTNPTVEEQQAEDWSVCQRPTFVYYDASSNTDLMDIFIKRFPNQVDSPAQAEVIIFGPKSELDPDDVNVAFDNGALLAIVDPVELMDESTLKMFQKELPNTDFSKTKIFAFNTLGYCFNMLVDDEFDGQYNKDFIVSSEEIISASDEYGKSSPEPESKRQWLYDNSYEHNYNYLQERIDPFVDFINDVYQNEVAKAVRKAGTRATGSKYYGDVYQRIEDCAFQEYNIPVSLNNIITHDVWHQQLLAYNYTRNKNGSISVRTWTNATYVFIQNGNEKAGDYYTVKTEVIPHGKSLWQVSSEKGGYFDTGRCRIYGYWLDNLEVGYELVDGEGNSVSTSDFRYLKTPIPAEGGNNAGFEWGLNGVMSNNAGKGTSGAFAVNLTSNTNYNASGFQYSRRADTPNPSYSYWASVNLTDDDYEDDGATNKNFPEVTHGEPSILSSWVWYIPTNQKLGVADGSKGTFGLKISVKPRYATWFHWRATIEYDSNKQTYNPPVDTRTIALPALNREHWGILSIQNKRDNHYVTAIEIFDESNYVESYYEETPEPVVRDGGRYYTDKSAEFTLTEGTYVVKYYLYEDGSWGEPQKRTVKVKSGSNVFEATTVLTVE